MLRCEKLLIFMLFVLRNIDNRVLFGANALFCRLKIFRTIGKSFA
ncbi:MAG: hypothetical protein CFH41_01393 [Alphaproteobacteria bacterium MarineAlpha11_Bin1]|nr:MAG: hypothetical protein CFH41_01393 [Alphaproteobacteria bacterium MarineAlpha11_Bin1]